MSAEEKIVYYIEEENLTFEEVSKIVSINLTQVIDIYYREKNKDK